MLIDVQQHKLFTRRAKLIMLAKRGEIFHII